VQRIYNRSNWPSRELDALQNIQICASGLPDLYYGFHLLPDSLVSSLRLDAHFFSRAFLIPSIYAEDTNTSRTLYKGIPTPHHEDNNTSYKQTCQGDTNTPFYIILYAAPHWVVVDIHIVTIFRLNCQIFGIKCQFLFQHKIRLLIYECKLRRSLKSTPTLTFRYLRYTRRSCNPTQEGPRKLKQNVIISLIDSLIGLRPT
jgi:hypothetical protein